MTEKFRGKYRIDSARLKSWNYGWNAFYFVTICTQKREPFFGDVIRGEMIRNKVGQIAVSEWLRTFEIRPDMNLEMGEFVVMPNHFHAIIGIGENEYNAPHRTIRNPKRSRDAMHCVSTNMLHCVSMNETDNPIESGTTGGNQFGPQTKNLASIIRGFKISVTKNARIINPGFAWQARFHDHIIRDERSFHRISAYIKNNPANSLSHETIVSAAVSTPNEKNPRQ